MGIRSGAVIGTGFLLAASLLIAPTTALTVTDQTEGGIVLCFVPRRDEPFTLSFTHSMFGGEVRETYTLTTDAKLQRQEITTANLAAAEYYAYTAGVSQAGERYRLELPAATFDRLDVLVDEVGHHRLSTAERRVDLLAVTGDGHHVELQAQSLSLLTRLFTDGC
ncbi:MAG: DUF1850 domain-containing protein [Chloroflexota bacterium]|nr:DUF1850 domain-containing protein [Chloroflexota bacterium]